MNWPKRGLTLAKRQHPADPAAMVVVSRERVPIDGCTSVASASARVGQRSCIRAAWPAFDGRRVGSRAVRRGRASHEGRPARNTRRVIIASGDSARMEADLLSQVVRAAGSIIASGARAGMTRLAASRAGVRLNGMAHACAYWWHQPDERDTVGLDTVGLQIQHLTKPLVLAFIAACGIKPQRHDHGVSDRAAARASGEGAAPSAKKHQRVRHGAEFRREVDKDGGKVTCLD
jgi:hypothetical protein